MTCKLQLLHSEYAYKYEENSIFFFINVGDQQQDTLIMSL
jgi:hypothetical protein